MSEGQKPMVKLEMSHDAFVCLIKSIDGSKDTIQKLRIHDGFKKAVVNDLSTVRSIINKSKKG